MTIQNNLSENKNSVVEHYVWFSGRKTAESMETRVRTFFFYANNPEMLPEIKINHSFHADLFYKQLQMSAFGALIMNTSQNLLQTKKGGMSELIIRN